MPLRVRQFHPAFGTFRARFLHAARASVCGVHLCRRRDWPTHLAPSLRDVLNFSARRAVRETCPAPSTYPNIPPRRRATSSPRHTIYTLSTPLTQPDHRLFAHRSAQVRSFGVFVMSHLPAFLPPLPMLIRAPVHAAVTHAPTASAKIKRSPPRRRRIARVPSPTPTPVSPPPSPPDNITSHPLLTPHQERKLLQQIRVLHTHADALASYTEKHNSAPTQPQLAEYLGISEQHLATQKANGIRARNDLVSANLRLVVRIATQVHASVARVAPVGKVVPLADLVQEGCIALIRSAELYDPEKGAKFTTYAWRAVVSACRRGATPANSIVKIPDRLRLASAKLRKFRESYIQQFGEEPSESTQQAQTKERLALIRKSENVRRGVDLDAAVGKDGQSTVMDVMVCQRSGPEEVVAQEMMRADVRDACYRSLPKRWADVVALRYGLNDGEPVVAKEVGKSFGISEVRVGQIVLQALEKLRKLEPDLLEHIYEL